ncbi:zinc metallopeptidase [Dyadobacter sp. LHD-138]|uniref:zinc metallopeptidase n=1 Tax=Dyadobacter sp. LHD-138 TaxID=3071413 RepID=UPI0027E01CE6|nr:zinc metallopeptidase [Dyadobacter sp. LHD-138]MDQ6478897.1 zinc metallopeptidase [Dyadobacter sp. LHD-138]
MGAYLIIILVMGISFYVQWRLKSKFEEYSQVGLSNGMSGREIAEKMLRDSGIYDVRVVSVEGQLTDHYNPQDKTVNLSPDVFHGRSVSAAAVASHECGHAVQHATAYQWLKFRSQMVPFLSFSSRYMQWVILGGILLLQTTPIPLAIGVALFAATTLFSFITLPVEYDASNRALAWIQQNRVVNEREYVMAADALKWAARTYLVAAISSLATLVYYVSILLGRRN